MRVTETDTHNFDVRELIKSINSQREVLELESLIELLDHQEDKISRGQDIMEWVKLFKIRENCSKKGGIILNRILEVDPFPPLTSGASFQFILNALITRINGEEKDEKCNNEDFWRAFGLNVANRAGNLAVSVKKLKRNERNNKKNDTENAAAKFNLNMTLLHPLSMLEITKRSSTLTADNLLSMAHTFPLMFTFIFVLNNEVLDYSKFTAVEVETVFGSFIKTGLNLSSIRAALRTLPSPSLVKLFEMLYWDLEEWEVMEVVEARGGMNTFLSDSVITGNFNFWLLLSKIKLAKPDFFELFAPFLPVDLHFEPLLRAINKWKRKDGDVETDATMLLAILNVIVEQEHQILTNIHCTLKFSETMDRGTVNTSRETVRSLCKARNYLRRALEGKSSFLSSWAGSFISPTLYRDSELLSLFKSYVADVDGFDEYFVNMWSMNESISVGVQFISEKLTTSFWKTRCGRLIIEFAIYGNTNFSANPLWIDDDLYTFLSSNRLSLLHHSSLALLTTFQGQIQGESECTSACINSTAVASSGENSTLNIHQNLCKQSTLDQWNQTQERIHKIISMQEMKSFERILILAEKSLLALKQLTLLNDVTSPEAVQSWISYQLYLYAAGSILIGMESNYLRKRALPMLLNTSPYKELIESYPYAFITNEILKSLLIDAAGRDLLRSNARLLHNLYDYSIFSGADFSDLKINVTHIRRGLHTVPVIQAISKIVSDKKLDEPINFIGGINYKVWKIQKYFNILWDQIRFPMLLKDSVYLDLMKAVFDYPMTVDPRKNNGKDLIWALIRWSINCELLFREFALGDDKNQPDFQMIVYNNLVQFETDTRKRLRIFLDKIVSESSDKTTDLVEIVKIVLSIPLSSHRIAALMTENYSSNSFRFDLVQEFDLLKSTVKLNEEKLTILVNAHHDAVIRFKSLIIKHGPNEESKCLWLNRLKVVNLIAANYFKSEPITKGLLFDAFSPTSQVSLYERTLLIRTMDFIDQPVASENINSFSFDDSFKDSNEIYYDNYTHNCETLKQKGLDSIDNYYEESKKLKF